jgi:CMP/dCMP kinase
MKKHIITITGVPGSGKSSTAAGVARSLGYDHFSSGDLFRKMAADRGISIEAMNLVAEKHKAIDHDVDEMLVRMGKERDDFVIDSRTAFHWMPQSFKVFLSIDPEIAAERTFAHIQKEGRLTQTGSSVEEVKRNTLERIESELKRYRDLYNIDITDITNYDLVIDTRTNGPEKVIDMVVTAYNTWINAS